MPWHIYLLTNTANGKMYVGKALDPSVRWAAHLSVARNGAPWFLSRAIRKYGASAFELTTIIGFDSEATAYEKERDWIRYFNSNDPLCGYNMTEGGEGGARKGHVISPESRKKISLANTGKVRSPEVRRQQSLDRKGRPGPLITEEGKVAIGAAHRGKPLSEEHKAKLKDARLRSRVETSALRRRLTDSQIDEIAALVSTRRLIDIAELFGTSISTISQIKHGWRPLTYRGSNG